MKIRVYVSPSLLEFATPAYGHRATGWECERWDTDDGALIVYSDRSDGGSVFHCAGLPAWGGGGRVAARLGRRADLAIGGSIARGLGEADGRPARRPCFPVWTLRDRSHIHRGPGVPGLGVLKWGVAGSPLINQLAQETAARLLTIGGVPEPKPRCPKGKQWALSLSHDCDRVFLFRALGYLADSWH